MDSQVVRVKSLRIERLRGLASLAVDAVEHGSAAIERVQRDTARLPYAILEALPVIGPPAGRVHAVHDALLTWTHALVRHGARIVGAAIDVALDEAG